MSVVGIGWTTRFLAFLDSWSYSFQARPRGAPRGRFLATHGGIMKTLFGGTICRGIVTATAFAFSSLGADIAAAPPARNDGAAAQMLMRFYPAPLPSTPANVTEDPAVWQAKVNGLLKAMPPMLRQSFLASESAEDFAANLDFFVRSQPGSPRLTASAAAAKAGIASVLPKALADADSLVFTPLTPCRIMDTRSATLGSGVQGPLAGGTLYHLPGFITAGTNWGSYGGNALSDCGVNSSVSSSIRAIAIVITILNPNFDAYLGVSDQNNLTTVLSNVALNYTHGQGLSTVYAAPQLASNTIYFAMPAGLSAQLIFDVVGYYRLETMACQRIGTGRFAIPAMAAGGTSFSCPAGFVSISATAGLATSDAGGTIPVDGVGLEDVHIPLGAGETNNPWNGVGASCRYNNTTASTAYGICHVICCRIAP